MQTNLSAQRQMRRFIAMANLVLALSCSGADGKVESEKPWALEPLRDQALPVAEDQTWASGEIDLFVLQKLDAAGLKPAPDADRYSLLRRVTFDLTGLPPTPTEVENFLNDSSGLAFENVVDRLLGSTAFGDHWARHWFDLSCYADLADVQGNVLIRDAWRYRDYVIAALNSDRPLDQFVLEQLAGDLLPYDGIEQQREQIVATGYLAIGPWTLQNYIKGQLAADVVDHQIDRIGRTFLGMTLSCARCHDHKFDPVPTRDYYSMAGIFHSTVTTSYDGPGVWSQIAHTTLPRTPEELAAIATEQELIKDLTEQRKQLAGELEQQLSRLPISSNANALKLDKAIAANAEGVIYEVKFDAAPTVWSDPQQATGTDDGLRVTLIREDGSDLVTSEHKPGAWSGKSDAQTLRPVTFQYTGDGSGSLRIRVTSSTPGSGRFGGAIDNLSVSLGGKPVYAENFDACSSTSSGTQSNTGLRVHAGGIVPDWTGAGINHSHAVDLGEGNIAIQFFGGNQVADLASIVPVTEEEKQAHARAVEIDGKIIAHDARIRELEARRTPLQAIAVREVELPADSPIYKRGDFQSPGELAPRGFITAVPVGARHSIPAKTSGRKELAEWLTASSNPLTARVLVNRFWHHLFGNGLVRSVDYFGVHGETPSHPELLDYLAFRMLNKDHWSLKKTLRSMVMSRTYRMSTAHNPAAIAKDPDNRLLWRMPRRRLSGESIRDAMLAASGQLDSARGGPCLGLEMPGNISGLGGNVNPPTWGGKIPNYIVNRRSIYLPIKRERPNGDLEILSIFDFPHPNEITGARSETTVPTQALFLMNAPFVKQQAQKLAERLLGNGELADDRSRIERLYLLAVSRPPGDAEIQQALAFLNDCENEISTEPDADPDADPAVKPRDEAWQQLCHALLASNDFLFRN